MRDRDYLFYELTSSLCATCLRKVEAKVVIQDQNVFMLKRCPVHGSQRVLMADDIEYYRRCREDARLHGNPLQDPTLELRTQNGTLVRANNDWTEDPVQAAQITAAGLAPSNTKESAIAATLAPGLYTAILAGVNNGTGIGLVEVYDRGGGP